jgi:ABC-type nitrate/sulfonate/bicarbonate transport system ATPase subunit
MSAAISAAISLRGVGKNFGALKVLDHVSFDVAQGEIVALLGTSGCGKSTLLNMVAGLLEASEGELWIDGKRTEGTKDRNSLGLEAASPAIPARERHTRANAILDLVGLQGFADAHPHQLSGGMRSRVALARSLVTGPRILLMDEPFSKLDPQMRSQMHDELLRIHAMQRMTVLFVTHDVEEAIVLADRVVVLAPRPGRVREIVDVALPRPRAATDPAVAEAIRQLRLLI